MDYYHGTRIGGLTVLKPFASQGTNLKEPTVYLTTSKQLALHYIWDYERSPGKSPMLDIRKDGVLVLKPILVEPLRVDGRDRKWGKEAFLDSGEATFGE